MRKRGRRFAVGFAVVLALAIGAVVFFRARAARTTTDPLRPLMPGATTWVLLPDAPTSVRLLDTCKELPDTYRGRAFVAKLAQALDGRLAAPPGTSLALLASVSRIAFGRTGEGSWVVFAEVTPSAATDFFGATRSLERKDLRDGAAIYGAARSARPIATPVEQLASTLVPEGDYQLAYLATRHVLVLGTAADVTAVVLASKAAAPQVALSPAFATLGAGEPIALVESSAPGGQGAGRLFIENGALAGEGRVQIEAGPAAGGPASAKLAVPSALPRDTIYFVALDETWARAFARALLPAGTDVSQVSSRGLTFVRSTTATTLLFDVATEPAATTLADQLARAMPGHPVERRGTLVAITTSGEAATDWTTVNLGAREIPKEAVALAWLDGKTAYGVSRRADQTALEALARALADETSRAQSLAWARRAPDGLIVHVDRVLPLLLLAGMPPPAPPIVPPSPPHEPLRGPECQAYAEAFDECVASAPEDKREELRTAFRILSETLAEVGATERSEARCKKARLDLPQTCPKSDAGSAPARKRKK